MSWRVYSFKHRVDPMADGPFQAALPIDLPYDEEEIQRRMAEGPPESAEEYLLRVRCAPVLRWP